MPTLDWPRVHFPKIRYPMAEYEHENREEEDRSLESVRRLIKDKRDAGNHVGAIIIEPITYYNN